MVEHAQTDDLPAIIALLEAAGLPPDGIAEHLAHTLVLRHAAAVVGSAALEVYGDAALLRSVAVAPTQRGHGLGQKLVVAALERARALGVRDLYLLTETAAGFFSQLGFQQVARAAVPAALHQSVQWSQVCPQSALVLHARLEPGGSSPA